MGHKNPASKTPDSLAERTRPRLYVTEIRWCAIGQRLRQWVRFVTRLLGGFQPNQRDLQWALAIDAEPEQPVPPER